MSEYDHKEATETTGEIMKLGEKASVNIAYKKAGPEPTIQVDPSKFWNGGDPKKIVGLDFGQQAPVLTKAQLNRIAELYTQAENSALAEIAELYRAMVTELEGRLVLAKEVQEFAGRFVSPTNPNIENWTWRGRVVFTMFNPHHKDEKLIADREFKQSFSPAPEHHVQLTWSIVVPRSEASK